MRYKAKRNIIWRVLDYMQRAYIDQNFKAFLELNDFEIMGMLSSTHSFELEMNQKRAWEFQIQHLRQVLCNFKEGRVFFEFSIPRMGKRADVILLIKNIIFVLKGVKSFLDCMFPLPILESDILTLSRPRPPYPPSLRPSRPDMRIS